MVCVPRMKIAVMQPYFFPYLGYFALINAVDNFVLYDDVSYIKNGWVNRNRIKVRESASYITVPVTNASTNYLINQVRIVDYSNFKKRLFRTLEMNYKKAPNYADTLALLTDVFQDSYEYIGALNCRSISAVVQYLHINTEMLLSSRIAAGGDTKGEQRVIDICRSLKGDTYINSIGGLELYSSRSFEQQGIRLKFIKMNDLVYRQGKGPFVPNLSIIDVLMWNSREDVEDMLKNSVLIHG